MKQIALEKWIEVANITGTWGVNFLNRVRSTSMGVTRRCCEKCGGRRRKKGLSSVAQEVDAT